MSQKAQIFQTLLAGLRFSGITLSSGLAYFYDPGTENVKAIYADRNKASQAANPYTLDADGRAELYGDGVYDVVIKNSLGVTKATWSDVALQDVYTNTNVLNSENYASLNAAITAIGSDAKILEIVTENFSMTGAAVVPSTLSIRFTYPGSLKNDYSVTFNGDFSAGNYRIFTGTGSVAGFNEAIPEWWATNTTPGTTDMTVAVQSAIDSISGTGNVILTDTYSVDTLELLNKTGLTISGSGTLKSSDGTQSTLHLTGCQDIVLRDFIIYGTFETEGPTGMAVSIAIDPNLAGATQVNKNIWIDNITFRYNPLNAIYVAGDGTTYGALSNIRITNCRMEYGLCFMLAVGVKNITVDNINIIHSSATPVNPGLAQDEDIAFFSDNTISCENVTVSNISIQANGAVDNIYTGRPKFSFGISDSGLSFTNLLVSNISCKDNLGNFTPSYGTTGATLYVSDANATRDGFNNAQFIGINFYNSPGIFIEANNLQFNNVSLDTFPSIAAFAGFGRAIDSATAVSTAGCNFNNVMIKDWSAGDPVIYLAEGGVNFKGLHILTADGAVWASPNSVFSEMVLDTVGTSGSGSFFTQNSFYPFTLSNITIKNAPYTGLKDNTSSRASGNVLSNALFTNNAVDTDVDDTKWFVYGILGAVSYADNAAALAGGLVAGNWYYNTTTNTFKVVT